MIDTPQTWQRLRKYLPGAADEPVWPDKVTPVAFDAVDPRRLHALLDTAFPGLTASFEDWYGNLTADTEFDPALCVPALTSDGQIAGFVQCWTSDFVKDLAVDPQHRGRGIGAALMQHAFFLFAQRGAPYVDLKVQLEEATARRLYARLGMVAVPA